MEIESHIFYAILDSVQFLASYGILSPIIAILIQKLLKDTYNVHMGPGLIVLSLLKVLVVESHILYAILDSGYNYLSISNLWTLAMLIKALDLKMLSGGGIDD